MIDQGQIRLIGLRRNSQRAKVMCRQSDFRFLRSPLSLKLHLHEENSLFLSCRFKKWTWGNLQSQNFPHEIAASRTQKERSYLKSEEAKTKNFSTTHNSSNESFKNAKEPKWTFLNLTNELSLKQKCFSQKLTKYVKGLTSLKTLPLKTRTSDLVKSSFRM